MESFNYPSDFTLKKVVKKIVKEEKSPFSGVNHHDVEIFLADKTGQKLDNFPALEKHSELGNF